GARIDDCRIRRLLARTPARARGALLVQPVQIRGRDVRREGSRFRGGIEPQVVKVALIHTTLPNPARTWDGGVTFYVHRLANQLSVAGHDVTVFSADPAPPDARYTVRA